MNPGSVQQRSVTVDDADVPPDQQSERLTVMGVVLLIGVAAMTGGWVCALGWVVVQLVALI